jgi:hypothetical protein
MEALLETMACMECGSPGVTIIGMDDDQNYAFCAHDCAKKHGWPWGAVKSEERKTRKAKWRADT